MRFCFCSLVVLFISCHSLSKRNEICAVADLLPHDTVINLNYEGYGACTTFYYSALDTTKPRLSKIVYYDKKGKEKCTIYLSFDAYVPATSLSIYDKSGRKTEEYYRIDEKESKPSLKKRIFQYDENGRVIKTLEFDFQRRIKKGIVRGLGSSGGCIIREEDYEEKKSWGLNTVWNNVYDEKGRLIRKFQSYPEHASQNIYLYEYNDQGRVIEERSLSDNRLYYVDNYLYYQGGYEHTFIIYDESGSRAKQWDGGLESIDTFRYTVDRFNNILEEKVIEEGGRQVSRDRNYYDEKNRIIRNEIYNEDDKILGFYVHQYNTFTEPKPMNLFMSNE